MFPLFHGFIFYRTIFVINSSLLCKCLLDSLLDSFLMSRHDHISFAVIFLSCINKCLTLKVINRGEW